MGAEVQRVSPDPQVAPASAAGVAFGRWFRGQRQLRGISVFFIAARTKIPPERIEAIERGEVPLAYDGQSRGTVRQLADAVGADPREAVERLREATRSAGRQPARRRSTRWDGWLAWGARLALLAALGAAAWAGYAWLSDEPATGAVPDVVYRPDYVDDLLDVDP